jgi:hypothetical protein
MTQEEVIEYISKPDWQKGVGHSKSGFKKEIKDKIFELTDFLPTDGQTLMSRAWCLVNGVTESLKCPICGNYLKWVPEKKKYQEFCSVKCMANSPDIKKKKSLTNIRKYGSSFSLNNEEIKKKADSTNIKKYGSVNISASPMIKQKKKDTFLKNYGVDNVFKSPEFIKNLEDLNIAKYGDKCLLKSEIIKDKIKHTNIEKYGVSNPILHDDIKKKKEQTNMERYGFISPLSNRKIRKKIKDTNFERYGVEHVTSLKSFHDSIKTNNVQKYGCEYSSQRHIDPENLKKLMSPEWLIEQHHIHKKTLTAISIDLGVDLSTVSLRMKEFNIEIKNHFSSIAENDIFLFLKNYTDDIIIRDRTAIHPYELDIYLPKNNLAIEFNGLYWHSELFKEKNYHLKKYEACHEKGIRLIQIFEDEWNDNKSIIEEKILYFIGKSKQNKIYARKTEIIVIDNDTRKIFLNKNHIQGDGTSSVSYGLRFDDKLVAVITFVKNSDNSFILNRYATSCLIVGGFSKLLTHFEKEFNYPKIITFADLRWSNGELYNNCGFKLDKILKPDYYWTTGPSRYHKFNFRHSGMQKKLKKYDQHLSENDNMKANNYFKVYDAGKLRFVKN